jgi:hypothetical protein
MKQHLGFEERGDSFVCKLRKSIYGLKQSAGGAICWRSKKQTRVAPSSTHSEYMAMYVSQSSNDLGTFYMSLQAMMNKKLLDKMKTEEIEDVLLAHSVHIRNRSEVKKKIMSLGKEG